MKQNAPVAISESLGGIGFSDLNVEMARLIRHYPLHQSRPDADRLADPH